MYVQSIQNECSYQKYNVLHSSAKNKHIYTILVVLFKSINSLKFKIRFSLKVNHQKYTNINSIKTGDRC